MNEKSQSLSGLRRWFYASVKIGSPQASYRRNPFQGSVGGSTHGKQQLWCGGQGSVAIPFRAP